MRGKKPGLIRCLLLLTGVLNVACSSIATQSIEHAITPTADFEQEEPIAPREDSTQVALPARPASWQVATHSNEVAPNYDIVFPKNKIGRIDLVIPTEVWMTMLNNMTDLDGEFGSFTRSLDDLPDYSENPIWVEATIQFEDHVWTHVGVRFKGSLSLRAAWRSGSLKLPFKLDFDEFEDEFPEINDQRFYGFKQLTLDNNFRDNSFMREAMASRLFAAAGVPVANTAFYELYVDYGQGPEYFGLYTLVEVIEDTVVKRIFGEDKGTVYEAEGKAASLASNTLHLIPDGFDRENNEDTADWSEIEALYRALHASERLSEPAKWRANLEAVFNVDSFLRWLAMNTIIQSWDSYGNRAHNYYLYHSLKTGRLEWIPWDHDSAFIDNKLVLSLSMDEVDEQWPLIRFLLDDTAYQLQYKAYVNQFAEGVFHPAVLRTEYERLYKLLEPYATREISRDVFATAVDELIAHNKDRYEAIQAYLANQ